MKRGGVCGTPPPHPAYRVTARISIRDETPISLPPREEVERLLAMPTPPSSPLSPWSSPLPQIPSPPLPPILSPLPILAPPPASPIRLLGYQAVMIWLRAKAASTSHSLPLPPLSPILVPTLSPPLLLPSTNCREDRPEVTLPPRKRLGIALGPRYDVRESSYAAAARPARGLRADYGHGRGFILRLDDEQTERQLLAGQFNMLFRDRRAYARTARLMEAERLGCPERLGDDPWMRLQEADRRRQVVITEMLAADHKWQKQFKEALKAAERDFRLR
ncbi:hypothetical protein Tco_1503126 [Tanacetum coccineum]